MMKKQQITIILILVALTTSLTFVNASSAGFRQASDKTSASPVQERSLIEPFLYADIDSPPNEVADTELTDSVLDDLETPFAGFIPNLGQLSAENSYIDFYYQMPSGAAGFSQNSIIFTSEGRSFSLTFDQARQVDPVGIDQMETAFNFFEDGKQVTGIYPYRKILYRDLYYGIDLSCYIDHETGKLDYEFTLQPGANLADLKIKFSKGTEVYLTGDSLILVDGSDTSLILIPGLSMKVSQGTIDAGARFIQKDDNTVGFEVYNRDINQLLTITLETRSSGGISSPDGISDTDGPTISNLYHAPPNPSHGTAVTVSADCDDVSGVYAVTAYYRLDGGSWSDSALLLDSGITYKGSIGSFSAGTDVDYYVVATDASIDKNNRTSGTINFSVQDEDNEDPVIQSITITPNGTSYLTVSVTATDSTGVASVTVHYRINSGSWENKDLDYLGLDIYLTDIGPLNSGDNVEYYISVVDQSVNANEVVDDNSGVYYQLTFDVANTPVISNMEYLPDFPGDFEQVMINVTMTDSSALVSTVIRYRINDGDWTSTDLTHLGSNVYSITFGPYTGGQIIYYFTAMDDEGYQAVDDNSGVYYSITVEDTSLSFRTFFGSDYSDWGTDIALINGRAFIVGYTNNWIDFPTTPDAYQKNANSNLYQGFFGRLSPNASHIEYLSLLGGSSMDMINNIALDAEDNIYLSGSVQSVDFPTTTGAYNESEFEGGVNSFISKFSSDGKSMIFSTYINPCGISDIAVDNAGCTYFAGQVYDNYPAFPTTAGAYKMTMTGGKDALVGKLSADGTSLLKATLYGSDMVDGFTAIALDSSGAYLTGRTELVYSDYAVVIAKFSLDLSTLTYENVLDGEGNGNDIVLDGSGQAYVTGYSLGGLSPTSGVIQNVYKGKKEGFVCVLNPSGTTNYLTYLGGGHDDDLLTIGLDPITGDIIVAGNTNSGYSTFEVYPTTTGALQRDRLGTSEYSSDVVFSKLSSNCQNLIYSTYLGGTWGDSAYGIQVDEHGHSYIVGQTNSVDFPVTDGVYRPSHDGDTETFVWKFTPDNQGPLITNVTTVPSNPTIYEEIQVSALIGGYCGVNSANLTYRVNYTSWETVNMNKEQVDKFTYNLGTRPEGSVIHYYITANDSSPQGLLSVNDNNGNYFTVTVSINNSEDDFTPPVISNVQFSPDAFDNITTVIGARITDTNSIQLAEVSYRVNSGPWQNVTMFPAGGNDYDTLIGLIAANSTVEFFISASDNSVNHNTGINDNSGSYFSFFVHSSDMTGPDIVDITISPLITSTESMITISATVTDPAGVLNVSLVYRVNGTSWVQLSMIETVNDRYQGVIEPLNAIALVEFYITSYDNSLNVNLAVEDNGGSYHAFDVTDIGESDITAPTISGVVITPADPGANDSITINATIVDSFGIEKVLCYYKVGYETWAVQEMSSTGNDIYQLIIGPYDNNPTVIFYITAEDSSYNSNLATANNNSHYYRIKVITYTTGYFLIGSDPFTGPGPHIIRVMDTDRNTDDTRIDTIVVSINSTTVPGGIQLVLKETSSDSGLFEELLYTTPVDKFSPDYLHTRHQDVIILKYNDPRNESAAPSIVYTNCTWLAPRSGTFFTDKEMYGSGDTATVYLYDLDLNKDPEIVDNITITLYSSRDLYGFELLLIESGPDTAEFTGFFQFSEIRSDPATATIHVWNNGKVYISYIDDISNEGFSDTVTAYVTFSKSSLVYSVLLDHLPEIPQNGDSIRVYTRLPNTRAVSSVMIRNQLTNEENELELIDISVYERIYGGWIVIDSPTLQTALHSIIIFSDGTNLTSSSLTVTSTLGQLFSEWVPLKEVMTAEIRITTVNIRREIVNDTNYHVSGTLLTTGENITFLTTFSPSGVIIYDTANETRLSPGKWLYTITSHKPGYVNGTSQFILSVASGYECSPGFVYFDFDGFKLELQVRRQCLLALTPSVPDTEVMSVVPSGYSPLITSFFALDVIETTPLYRLDQYSGFPIIFFDIDFPIDDPNLDNKELMFAINMHVPIFDGTWSKQSGYPYHQWYSRDPRYFEAPWNYRGHVRVGYIVGRLSDMPYRPALIYNYIEMGLLAPSHKVSGQIKVMVSQVGVLQEMNLYGMRHQLPVDYYCDKGQFNTGSSLPEADIEQFLPSVHLLDLYFVTLAINILCLGYYRKKKKTPD